MNESHRVATPAAARNAAAPVTRPLTTLLIANRGEIAVRVARTARRLGIATVAVYSDADRTNPHVAACDAAAPIGGLTPAESYLVADKLIAAARKSGADAVHPGYGFLAENAQFSAALPPQASSSSARRPAPSRRWATRLARAAAWRRPASRWCRATTATTRTRRTCSPRPTASASPLWSRRRRAAVAAACARWEAREALSAALQSARSEAEKAFGDGRLILERALVEPRHVEIQVFADRHGNVLHLGERDCSVQRRHQKIVEEAPSPAVDAALRAAMGDAAVAAGARDRLRGRRDRRVPARPRRATSTSWR